MKVIDIKISQIGLLAKHHWRKLVLAGSCGALVGLSLAFSLPPRFVSKETLILPSQSSAGASLQALGQLSALAGGSVGIGVPRPSVETAVAILRSRLIAEHVIRANDLRMVYKVDTVEDAVKELEEVVKIVGSKEGVIAIHVDADSPALAASVASSYFPAFRSVSKDLSIVEAQARRKFFEAQVVEAADQLVRAETALLAVQTKLSVFSPSDQGRALVDATARLAAMIASKETELSGVEIYASKDNPQVKRLKAEIESLRTQLSRLEGQKPKNGSTNEINSKSIPGTAAASVEYVRGFREFKYREAVYESVLRQLELARLDEAKDSVYLQVLDTANLPVKKAGPSKLRYALLCGSIALFFALAWLLLTRKEAWLSREVI